MELEYLTGIQPVANGPAAIEVDNDETLPTAAHRDSQAHAVPLGFAVKALYWITFGWWLDPYMGRKGQRHLAEDVEVALPFLFSQYHARFIPNEGVRFPEPFDHATVTLALDDVVLRFVRGRGELHVNIAPTRSPKDCHEVRVVLGILEGNDGETYPSFGNLRRAAYALERNMERLKSYFAPAGSETKQQQLAGSINATAVTREWDAEMNAKLKRL